MTFYRGITQTILRLRCQYGITPDTINAGNCGDFANEIDDQIPGAIAVWGDELESSFWSEQFKMLAFWQDIVWGHCFVMFNGRFYDSECPLGCDYPNELPFFQREIEFCKEYNETLA